MIWFTTLPVQCMLVCVHMLDAVFSFDFIDYLNSLMGMSVLAVIVEVIMGMFHIFSVDFFD